MTRSTTYGYPYPEPTDPVQNGADAIKALANAVDVQLKRTVSGLVTVTFAGTQSASANVVFPAGAFTAPPLLIACQAAFVGDFTFSTASSSPTAGQIRAATRNATSVTANVPMAWLAIAV